MPANNIPDIDIPDALREQMGIYLREEIDQAIFDREDLQDLWKEIQEYYEKTELDSKKDWPFKGAAAIMIPVMPTYVEQIHAKIFNTIFTPEDPFSAAPTLEQMNPYSKAMRKWMTWHAREELNLQDVCGSLFMEYLKLGGMVAKIIYTEQTSSIYRYDESTGEYQEIVEVMRDAPEILHIPLADFIFPLSSRSLDEAPWKAHRFRLTWNEVLRRAASGAYNWEAVEEIEAWYETRKTEYEQHRDDLAKTDSRDVEEHEFFEVWFEYIIDVDSETLEPKSRALPKKLVGTFHKESQKLVRLQHNWYPLQLDPFEFAPYVVRENQVYGIGVGQMTLPFQKEISTMHNQRLDNATIANLRGYKYKSDSSIPAELNLYPGVGVPVDDMQDFEPFDLGTKYDSTIQEEQHTLQFLQQRVGIQEYSPEVFGSAGTATSALAIMQESTRRFDGVIRIVRSFLARVEMKAILLYKRYYTREKLLMILGEDGMLVAEMLDKFTEKQLYDGMGISVTATTSSTSKDLERQNKLALFNLLVQYYAQLTQYLMALQNPNAPPELRASLLAIVNGMSEFVREILEDFNIRGRTEFALDLARIQQAAQQIRPNPAAGADPSQGMGGVSQPTRQSRAPSSNGATAQQ